MRQTRLRELQVVSRVHSPMGHLIRGGKMLIKNNRRIADWITETLVLLLSGRRIPAACLLAACALLSVSRLTAQDLLLKEYIYLDGRLLAVERQIVGPVAKLPADGAAEQAEMALAQEFPIKASQTQKHGHSGMTAMPGFQVAPMLEAHFGSVHTGFARLGIESGSCLGCDRYDPQYRSFRLHWKNPELSTKQSGGQNEDL